MILAAFISFIGVMLLISHLGKRWFRRLVGYKGLVDLILHSTILWMFFGTSTLGLLQAEAAGIMFSLFLRGYSYLLGFERFNGRRWIRYAGRLT